MTLHEIEKNVADILKSLPPHVTLVAAAKTRSVDEVKAAIRGGVKILGYNYIQEAERIREEIGEAVQWHLIGHLQRNKAKKALTLFDMIETLDSLRLAQVLDKLCAERGQVLPVLVEINSGKEPNKAGILPEEVDDFVRQAADFPHLKIMGLMTMGPVVTEPEQLRPYFRLTREAFERLRDAGLSNVEMRYLSMGMSDSYQVAIEEGANIVRLGTKLFGPRAD
jgi:pyridoxal phosphate enzyme (YggS family)